MAEWATLHQAWQANFDPQTPTDLHTRAVAHPSIDKEKS